MSDLSYTMAVLILLHDTTQFSYRREDVAAIGVIHDCNSGRDKLGRLRHHTICGISMHYSLAVTLEGLSSGPDSDQVLDPHRVSWLQRLKEENQPNPRTHWTEREHPLVGEPETVHGLIE